MVTPKDKLIEKVLQYNPHSNTYAIGKAYDICKTYHGTQLRKSGEPYFSHPVAVSEQIIDMQLDDTSIILALLHDTLEDTEINLAYLEKEFSKEVAHLVDGITKLKKIQFQTYQVKQATNFRKLFLALSKDIRVLIVKLCDRLHNMQTIQFQGSRAKMRSIAIETLEIYAPLAQRIGMYKMRDALQDLSFVIINNRARASVVEKLQNLNNKSIVQGFSIADTVAQFKKLLVRNNIHNAFIYGREKTPYSIWQKLICKRIAFEHLSDVIGFRIVTKDIEDCYRALGAIHRNYKAIPGGFTDYISMPKSSQYQSIHTTIWGPCQCRIEVQIRTKEMEHEAEYGLASHWSYKEKAAPLGHGNMKSKHSTVWIEKILSTLKNANNAEEFLEFTKLEMSQDEIFVFTPKGDIVNLPNEASVIDFAFEVHEDLGLFCSGANIDGMHVGIDHRVKNGDHIKIITSNDSWPKLDWLQCVVTGKAKTAIHKASNKELVQHIKMRGIKMRGMNMLYKTLAQYDQPNKQRCINEIMHLLHKKNIESSYIDIANGTVDIIQMVRSVLGGVGALKPGTVMAYDLLEEQAVESHDLFLYNDKNTTYIKGLDKRLAIALSSCCNPCVQDSIIGIIEPCSPIAIHTKNCYIFKKKLIHHSANQVIELSWDR